MQTIVFLDTGSFDAGDLDWPTTLPGQFEMVLHEHTKPIQVASRIAQASVLVSNKVVLDASALRAAKHLQLVVAAATGTDHIDLETARDRDIQVSNCRDYATDAVAEFVVSLILGLTSGSTVLAQRVRDGAWQRAQHFALIDQPRVGLSDLTVGIVGFGVLGKAVAGALQRLGVATLIAERPGQTTRPGRVAFDEVLSQAHLVTLHCPLNEQTDGLFDAETFAKMRPGSFLVNTARGAIVDSNALLDALRDGTLAGAAVDVLSQEPPEASHPLIANTPTNLVLTPHAAWASRQARQALIQQIFAIITTWQGGESMHTVL